MKFYVVAVSLAGTIAAVGAFTLTAPSGASYWVQFSTNTIAWSTVSGDPASVSLQVINKNQNTLNGAFSIAEYVQASQLSFTVTNVALVVGDGFEVQMINPMNHSEIYATSAPFSVKPSGTTPVPMTETSGPQKSSNITNTPSSNVTNTTRNNVTNATGSSINTNSSSITSKNFQNTTGKTPFNRASLKIQQLKFSLRVPSY
ncbi:hypothetical protein O181_054365 [Austropuccinia psidii MF-1]|uniref:Yeast cell wall synthesis Kre9/Knh1-like N-terminal domain-containing protein n=1 Tax=Austropuccinia psidii MF-1 TaxID=1389203 RepID=A0A9Q3E2B8_9BASI|nr:hypothetical protein [Austropuccinia psidii MF-1]